MAAIAVLGASVALTASAAHAQLETGLETSTPGWYFVPNVSLTEEWDDNIFRSSTQRESDFITRVTPGFTGGYRSEPFTLLGSFSFDAEVYAKHTELDGAANGKRAAFQTTYLPTRNLTLGLGAGYTETQTPSTLNELTNVEQARTNSTQLNASPNASYRFSPLMIGTTSYAYSRTEASGITTLSHHGDLGLSRQLTPGARGGGTAGADTAGVTYAITVTEFSGRSSSATSSTSSSTSSSSTTSHTLLPSYTHYFTELTKVSLQAGPRYEEGSVRPEVNAELAHHGRSVDVSLGYFRSETTLTGETGLVKTEGGRATLRWQPPVRGLTVSLVPAYSVTSSTSSAQNQDFTVYSAVFSASYQLTRWLTATTTYQFTHQQQKPNDLEDNIASLRLDVVYPVRIR